MNYKDNAYRKFKALSIFVILFCLSLLNFGCKGFTKMPQVKYDLTEQRKKENEKLNQKDTVVILTLGSGYNRGSEHNHYSITKRNNKTVVKRTSNFQKFKHTEITSSSFPWQYIINNFDKFVADTVKTEKKTVAEDGEILFQQAASHGQTTFLKIKLGNIEHEIYLAPLVDSYNKGNINLDLIEKVKKSILDLNYRPSERIKYRWVR